MFKEQVPYSHRVPARAGLSFSEDKLLSGNPAVTTHASPRSERHNEARQRVHASAFSEILRRVPGRNSWTNIPFRSF